MMTIREDTPLRDILAVYPWLIDEAVRLDDRFRLLKTPIGRMLLKKATVADASARTGFPSHQIIAEITKMIEAHGAS